MDPPRPEDPRPALSRLRALVVVLALCFVLPAVLWLRLAGRGHSVGVAVMILALVLPATGALILRLNPDLVPEGRALRTLGPADWLQAVLLAAALLAGAWWVAGRLQPA